jgi:uncharacterized Tic20 family protein
MTQYNPPGAAAPVPLSESDSRMWATLVHVGGIIIGFISPLIGYLVMRDRSQFVREHSATALNFQITMAIAHAINTVLVFVTLGLWGLIAWLVALAIWVVTIVFSIIAAMAANKGEPYKYPLSFPFVK